MSLFLIKSGTCLAIFWLIYHLILRRENTFVFNRFFLLGSLVFALVVPFFSLPTFFPTVLIPQENAVFEIQQSFSMEQTSNETLLVPNQTISNLSDIKGPFPWFQAISLLYFLGVLFMFIRFSIQLFSLYRLFAKGKITKNPLYNLVLLDQETMPFTFLNYLFVNEKTHIMEGIENEILQHELTHIRQKHSLDLMFVELLKIVFWFNPFVYLYKKAIQLNHEFLADRGVIASFPDIFQYQKLLISKVIGKEFVFKMASPIFYSVTKERLLMMRKSTSFKKSIILKVGLIPIVVILIGVFGQTSANSIATLEFKELNSKDFEAYIDEALSQESNFVLLLDKLDIAGAKAAYNQLSEEEKLKVTELPFLDDNIYTIMLDLQKAKDSIQVSIYFEHPPEKKTIKEEMWLQWLKTKYLEVIIDEKEVDKSILANYTPQDFALYQVRELDKKNFLQSSRFKLTLTTNAHFHEKFVTSRKKIHTINASYLNGDKAEIPYFMKFVLLNQNSELNEYYPENYLERALQAFLTHEFKEMPKVNAILDIRKSFWINVTRNGQKEMVAIPYN